jgi:signal transduction histidine kinase
MSQNHPIPSNEMERLLALSEFDLDYTDLDKTFSDLTKLAAKIAGTDISLVNLIDSFTQWSVSAFGIDFKQTPRENSVCEYTILAENDKGFEVKDLSKDERFKDRDYVVQSPFLKYYYGIPLKLNDEISLGALCVLDQEYKDLSAEKKEMLEIIAGEVVNRIKIHYAMANLNLKVEESNNIKNRVAHDIRGPIGGIIGLAEIIQSQGDDNKLEEVLAFISLIQKSGRSILDLADEILTQNFHSSGQAKRDPKDHEFTLLTLQSKLLDMYNPQAMTKKVQFHVSATPPHGEIPFPKNKILQILGNLISNSIKFTAEGGSVEVMLDMKVSEDEKILFLKVKDNGVGIGITKIAQILEGGTSSIEGTSGEKGFGFGLNLVNHLVKGLNGKLFVTSTEGQGSEFELVLPMV